MIKIERVEVFGWEAAIRGMRNPMNAWDKIDSGYDDFGEYYLGDNDHKRAVNLANAGDDHGKYARFLVVQLDIDAPLYWWKEFRTYRKGRKFLDDGDELLDPEELELHIETNSCSTMHKIHAKPFTLEDFSHEHLENIWLGNLVNTITCLNHARDLFLDTKDKKYWWQMIQLLPSSYNQKRTVQLNYQVLRRMYHARKNHKQDEWRDFCKWVETLPYSTLITGEKSC